MDVLIIGGGVIGLSIAVRLSSRGLSVTVVDPQNGGGGASRAAGAMLGCFGEVTASGLHSDAFTAKHALALRTRELWRTWADELADHGGGDLLNPFGTDVVLNAAGADVVDTRNFAAIESAARAGGEEYSVEYGSDWAADLPQQRERPFATLSLPHEGSVSAERLLTALRTTALARGARFVDGAVDRVSVGANGRLDSVVLRSGERFSPRHTVVAAGAFSRRLAESIPDLPPVMPIVAGVGVSVVVAAPGIGAALGRVVRTPNRAFACGLHAIPRSRDEIYIGATNVVYTDPRTWGATQDVHFLIECAMRQLPVDVAEAGIVHVQTGNRPVPLDGAPVLGMTAVDGLWFVTGTYRDGLFLSPLLSQQLTDAIVDGRTDVPGWEKFGPHRRRISAGDRQTVVDEAVAHSMASGFETDWGLSNYWLRMVKGSLRSTLRSVADRIVDDAMPVPEVLARIPSQPSLLRLVNNYDATTTKVGLTSGG